MKDTLGVLISDFRLLKIVYYFSPFCRSRAKDSFQNINIISFQGIHHCMNDMNILSPINILNLFFFLLKLDGLLEQT